VIAPAGLYVHLPYCAVRCAYCTFFVSTDDSSRADYLRAVEMEAAILSPDAAATAFDSMYLGGGTPSRIAPNELGRLLDVLRRSFRVGAGSEVTLEANPEDVLAPLVSGWIEAGVSRISLGVQSLNDAELSAVGRSHDAPGARRALSLIAEAGVGLCADLILGLPGQTPGTFRASLEELLAFPVEHVSIYLLEDSRETAEDRRQSPERYLADDTQAVLWLDAGEVLAAHGFEHYEISNWARPGRQARHNRKYWDRTPTLGLGASAHEFWDGRRRANVASLPRYIADLDAGRRPTVFDVPVSPEQAEKERIVLGLRTSAGVPSAVVQRWMAGCDDSRLALDWEGWMGLGLLRESGGRVSFTERGFLISNEILCRFV
jgi:putative oxygen-independent coproporphyrinogen III oxidase